MGMYEGMCWAADSWGLGYGWASLLSTLFLDMGNLSLIFLPFHTCELRLSYIFY
jgi:hypothetical protein